MIRQIIQRIFNYYSCQAISLQILNINLHLVLHFIIGRGLYQTGFVTRLTRRVPLVEQELLTLPEHLSSPPVFSGVRVVLDL
jgi:hypothetical protein